MSRPERRRQERAARKGRVPVLIAGDGVVAAELPGHTFEARPHADLPPKVRGRHRWIATAAYVVTVEQAASAYDPDAMTFLDHENLMHLAIWCWDCERPLGRPDRGGITVDSSCPAEASDA